MNFTTIITDDDPVILLIHRVIVRKSGVSEDPLCFSNATDTLAYLDELDDLQKTILILLDINMPGMSGWQFLDKLIEKGFDSVHVIIVSSSVNTGDRNRAGIYKNVIGYIEKPISEAKLRALLSK